MKNICARDLGLLFLFSWFLVRDTLGVVRDWRPPFEFAPNVDLNFWEYFQFIRSMFVGKIIWNWSYTKLGSTSDLGSIFEGA
jgi:hypothetical protein